MASVSTFFLLFLLPFIIAPFGVTQFENPKVIFGEIGIIILFLIVLFTTKVSLSRKQALIYLSIFVLTIIDLLFLRTNIAFFGNAFRMQGIFLLWCLLLFSLISQVTSLRATLFTMGAWQSSTIGEIASSYLLAMTSKWWIYCLLLYIELLITFLLPVNASQRYVGTLGEPNALAAFALFLWPFGWFAIQSEIASHSFAMTKRVLLLIPVVCLLYLSGSKSGVIAFVIELLFIVLLKKFTVKKSVIICLCIYFLSYLLPFFDNTPYENRTEVWKAAAFAGIINPGIGQGFGNTEIALHNAAAGLDLPIQYYYVDSSHNIFLDWWVQGGVVGISLFIYLVYTAFSAFVYKRNKRELVLLLGCITMLSFNPASVVGLLSFWWIMGQRFTDSV